MVPPEQVIEQTINKNQKGAGGIAGSSTNMGFIQRWILSSHIIATWNSDFKQRIGVDKQKTQLKDVLKLRKDFDEAAVHSCIDTINQ